MKHRCPICKKTVKASSQEQSEFFPFCSERCKLIDLGTWLDAKYKIVSKLQSDQSSQPSDTSSDTTPDKR